MKEKDSCFGCTERTPICHGKDENGNWRCKNWGEKQDEKQRQEKAKREMRDVKAYYKAKKMRIAGPQK